MDTSSPPNIIKTFNHTYDRLDPARFKSLADGINRMASGVLLPQAVPANGINEYPPIQMHVAGCTQDILFCVPTNDPGSELLFAVQRPYDLCMDPYGVGMTSSDESLWIYPGSAGTPTYGGLESHYNYSPDGGSRMAKLYSPTGGPKRIQVLSKPYYSGSIISVMALPGIYANYLADSFITVPAGEFYVLDKLTDGFSTEPIPDDQVGQPVLMQDINVDSRRWVDQGSGTGILAAIITAVNTNGTMTCTSDDVTITVQMAPVMTNSTASRVAFGHTITYTYSNAQTRTATWGGTNTETEVIVPMINVGETIYVAKVGANYQDMNLAAHAWAKQ